MKSRFFLFAALALFGCLVFSAQAATLPVSTGLQVWLDASDTTTVGLCNLGGSHAWQDKSPNAYLALPAFEYCDYNPDAFALDNGSTLGGIQLNGTTEDTYIFTDSAAGSIGLESLTIFAVGNFQPTKNEYILTKRSLSETGYRFTTHTDGTMLRYQAGTITARRDVDFSSNNIFAVVHDRTLDTVSMFADGQPLTMLEGLEVGATEYVDSLGDITDTIPLYVGSNQCINGEMLGDFGEILIYNRALDATEIGLVNDYLMQKWITGATPDVPGDANRDGKVDGSDVTILANNWQAGVPGGDSSVLWTMGDFNGDQMVDGSDVTILANNWQYGVTSAATAVPEPSSLAIILAGVLGLAFTVRKKLGRISMKRFCCLLVGLVVCGVCLSATASTLPVTGGVVIWLDPSDLNSLEVCDQGSTHAWTDISPNAYPVDRVKAAKYDADAFALDNGQTIGGVHYTSDESTYSLFRDNTIADFTTESLTIFAVGNFTDGYILTKRSDTGYRFTTYASGTAIRYQAGDATAIRDVDFSSNNVFAVVHDRSMDTVSMYADGQPLTLSGGAEYGAVEYVSSVEDLSDPAPLYIGCNRGINNAMDGDFGELLIYNRALDANEIASVNAYLMEKWVTGPAVTSAATVPEPSTIVLLLLGTLGLITVKAFRH